MNIMRKDKTAAIEMLKPVNGIVASHRLQTKAATHGPSAQIHGLRPTGMTLELTSRLTLVDMLTLRIVAH